MKPGAEGVEFDEPRRTLRECKEHRLCRIFRQRTITQPPQANAEKPARMPFDDLAERRIRSFRDELLDKLAVQEHHAGLLIYTQSPLSTDAADARYFREVYNPII